MRLSRLTVIPALALLAAGCAAAPSASPAGVSAEGTVRCDYRTSGPASKPVTLPQVSDVPATGTVPMTVDLGDAQIAIELDRAAAPCTVNSFASLAEQGFFDDTACHRLSTGGMAILQCGDPTATGSGGPGYVFNDELAQTTGYPAGALAMANRGPDTNGSQFFFVFGDTALSPNYTVFGHVDAAGVATLAERAARGHDNSYGDGTGRPVQETVIRSVVSG